MASGMTERGRFRILEGYFQSLNLPFKFYIALVTNFTVPSKATNLLGDLQQIAVGNGYLDGGFELNPDAVDFTLVEDDTNDRSVLTVKDVTWTASLGPIPSSGLGASFGVLTDDNATVASRDVYAYFDLSTPRSVAEFFPLTISGMQVRLREP